MARTEETRRGVVVIDNDEATRRAVELLFGGAH